MAPGRSRAKGHTVFGGIRLVLFGDLLQLGPVLADKRGGTVLRSKAWKAFRPHLVLCELTRLFRQDHADYMRLLHEIRTGELSQFALQQIKALTAGQPGKNAKDPDSTYISSPTTT